jgi:hypothetical protein
MKTKAEFFGVSIIGNLDEELDGLPHFATCEAKQQSEREKEKKSAQKVANLSVHEDDGFYGF